MRGGGTRSGWARPPSSASAATTCARGYSGGAQTRWLESTLAAARRDASIDWIVVQVHQCACSSAPDGNGSDLGRPAAVAAALRPYEVDLVLSGHDHGYERSFPVRGFDSAPARRLTARDRHPPAPSGDHSGQRGVRHQPGHRSPGPRLRRQRTCPRRPRRARACRPRRQRGPAACPAGQGITRPNAPVPNPRVPGGYTRPAPTPSRRRPGPRGATPRPGTASRSSTSTRAARRAGRRPSPCAITTRSARTRSARPTGAYGGADRRLHPVRDVYPGQAPVRRPPLAPEGAVARTSPTA